MSQRSSAGDAVKQRAASVIVSASSTAAAVVAVRRRNRGGRVDRTGRSAHVGRSAIESVQLATVEQRRSGPPPDRITSRIRQTDPALG